MVMVTPFLLARFRTVLSWLNGRFGVDMSDGMFGKRARSFGDICGVLFLIMDFSYVSNSARKVRIRD